MEYGIRKTKHLIIYDITYTYSTWRTYKIFDPILIFPRVFLVNTTQCLVD